MRRHTFASAASAIALSVFALPAAQAQSLCTTAEKSLFSCEIGRKVLSVCASKDLDENKGTLQYRYGTTDKLDLAYPEKAEHPKKHFTVNRLYSSAEGSLILELEFKRGTTTYTVFTQDLKGKKSAGVTVNVNGKDTELKCKATKGTENFSEITSLDLPEPK
jgi:hypothetical protein